MSTPRALALGCYLLGVGVVLLWLWGCEHDIEAHRRGWGRRESEELTASRDLGRWLCLGSGVVCAGGGFLIIVWRLPRFGQEPAKEFASPRVDFFPASSTTTGPEGVDEDGSTSVTPRDRSTSGNGGRPPWGAT
jgi:hypothetical protein